jgi:hypothetical protein
MEAEEEISEWGGVGLGRHFVHPSERHAEHLTHRWQG